MALQWTPAPGLAEPLALKLMAALESFDWTTAKEIYHIRHRSVFQACLAEHEIAIKEVRHLRFRQRVRLRHHVSSKAAIEFNTACELHHRKPITPKPFALGRDQNLIGLNRVLQVYEWLPEARSLTDCVRAGDRPWDTVVPFLWDCAALGLVHGGHSSENLIYSNDRWWVIDLAEAQLHDRIDKPGFVRDVARIARKLIREEAADEATIEDFVEAVAAHQRPVSVTPQEIHTAMTTLLEEASRRKG